MFLLRFSLLIYFNPLQLTFTQHYRDNLTQVEIYIYFQSKNPRKQLFLLKTHEISNEDKAKTATHGRNSCIVENQYFQTNNQQYKRPQLYYIYCLVIPAIKILVTLGI